MFSPNNKLFEILGRLVDLFLLNFLFIICSIPLVTIYPAFVALVGAVKDIFEDETTPAWKQFFRLFYHSMKKGVMIWFTLFVISVVIVGNIIATFYLPLELQNFLLPFNIIMCLLFFGVFSYLTKLFIMGEHRFKTLVIQSLFLYFRKPLKPLLLITINVGIVMLSIYLRFVPLAFIFSFFAFTFYFLMFERNLEVENG